MSEFSQVLGKLEMKSCVLDSWDIFPKIVWGLSIKSQEIRSQERKSWGKYIRRKKTKKKSPKSCKSKVKSRTFSCKILIYASVFCI